MQFSWYPRRKRSRGSEHSVACESGGTATTRKRMEMEIIFILYRPGVPGNIGATARALETMGFTRLRLIEPCDHLSVEAKMMAHGSHESYP